MSMHRPDDATPQDLLRRAFDAYNRRDAEALLAMVGDDVAWSTDDGTLGKGALRAYWTEGWSRARIHDAVTHIEAVTPTRFLVDLDQRVHSTGGSLISAGRFRYAFVVADGRIRALDAREPAPPRATEAAEPTA